MLIKQYINIVDTNLSKALIVMSLLLSCVRLSGVSSTDIEDEIEHVRLLRMFPISVSNNKQCHYCDRSV